MQVLNIQVTSESIRQQHWDILKTHTHTLYVWLVRHHLKTILSAANFSCKPIIRNWSEQSACAGTNVVATILGIIFSLHQIFYPRSGSHRILKFYFIQKKIGRVKKYLPEGALDFYMPFKFTKNKIEVKIWGKQTCEEKSILVWWGVTNKERARSTLTTQEYFQCSI